ncbi:MAG: alpha/beta hydrolase [Ginsengibacter sp.]|jgi:pimeloyl-ACP methyl ester carboxylesterase
MKNIYCISGFGADERVFSRLDFGNNRVNFLKWETPEKNESLDKYTQRFLNKIVEPNPVLVGLSFGGMMSVEIAKRIRTEKIFMISSIQTQDEMPWIFRITGKSGLNKVLPLKPFSFLEPIENYNLGVKNEEEKTLVREYRKNISQIYTDWAINQIVNWQNRSKLSNLIHIHGSADRIFPIKNVHPDFIIKGGGHFMIMNRAKEINDILGKEL